MSSALILIGSPGAGKTSVLYKLTALLQQNRVNHGWIESELFTQGWPPFDAQTGIDQLAGAVKIQRASGRELMLIVATTETEVELSGVIEAAAADEVRAVCLAVPPQIASARVAEREPDSWLGKPALVRAAAQLSAVIPNLNGIYAVVSTEGRSPDDVAAEIYALIPGCG